MTISPPSRVPGRVLMTAAMVLAAAGIFLVCIGLSSSPSAVPAPPSAAASSPAAPVARTGSTPATVSTARWHRTATPTGPARTVSPSDMASELPPPDSGPSADPIVQRALEQAIPADLPAGTAKRLVDLGRAVWTAEITGTDRQRWPRYFTGTGPPSGYTRLRIQAAIARREGGRPNTAVVHLVWAGADPSGTYLDSRTASIHFTKENSTWTPVR
jgi:hypothetical protein